MMPKSNDEVPDLGIDTGPRPVVRLNPPRRKARRRPSAWDEGMLAALPRFLLLLLKVAGVLFLALIAWGLFFAPGRPPGPGPGVVEGP